MEFSEIPSKNRTNFNLMLECILILHFFGGFLFFFVSCFCFCFFVFVFLFVFVQGGGRGRCVGIITYIPYQRLTGWRCQAQITNLSVQRLTKRSILRIHVFDIHVSVLKFFNFIFFTTDFLQLNFL